MDKGEGERKERGGGRWKGGGRGAEMTLQFMETVNVI